MKTLHFYLLRQVLATLLMTVAVFTFVLLLGNMLKEIMNLLVNRQATIGGVIQAIGLLIPFVLVFALPMGMLTAALLVFGRFSADQELTAVRSSGVSLLTLASPILILSIFLCGVSAWMNMEVAPKCRVAYKRLIAEMMVRVVHGALPEGRFIRDFPPYTFYIGKNDGRILGDIYIYREDTNGLKDMTITAPKGRVEITNQQVVVTLFNAETMDRMNGAWQMGFMDEFPITNSMNHADAGEAKPQLSEMTFGQLQGELKEVQRGFALPLTGKIERAQLRAQKAQLEKIKSDLTLPIRFQIHRQIATAFACFGFTLVGIPLGIRAHRRETNIGIAMALVLVLVYYSFVITAQSLQSHAELAPYLIVWLPNFIFQAVGGVMLWRANKGI